LPPEQILVRSQIQLRYPEKLVALNWTNFTSRGFQRFWRRKARSNITGDAALCALIADGHTNVYVPTQLNSFFAKPPIRLNWWKVMS